MCDWMITDKELCEMEKMFGDNAITSDIPF